MAYQPYAAHWTEQVRIQPAEGATANHTAGTSSTDTVRVTSVAGRGDDGRCLGPESPPLFELAVIRSEGTLTLP